MWFQSIAEVREKWNILNDQQWGQLEEDVSKMYLYPQDRVWVLRNFTTRQIVRSGALTPPAGTIPSEAIPPKANSMKDKFQRLRDKLITRHDTVPEYSPLSLQAPTLAQVFLVQTARADSSDSILDFEKKFHFQHGAWAGHAFDVVTLEQYTRDVEAMIIRWIILAPLSRQTLGTCAGASCTLRLRSLSQSTRSNFGEISSIETVSSGDGSPRDRDTIHDCSRFRS
jgi:hypothetical protein